jgi:hypothetical protein
MRRYLRVADELEEEEPVKITVEDFDDPEE